MSEEFDDLAQSLRQGVGRELRDEAAVDEELTELQRRRRLDLADAVRLAMHRGDRIVAAIGELTFSAPVTEVGSDYLTMVDHDRIIDIRLEAASLAITPSTRGGHSSTPASATFRARLAEFEQSGARVEVVTRHATAHVGRIEVVAADHLVVAGDAWSRIYLPLELVAVVISSRLRP